MRRKAQRGDERVQVQIGDDRFLSESSLEIPSAESL
jgi:hypothetical protein